MATRKTPPKNHHRMIVLKITFITLAALVVLWGVKSLVFGNKFQPYLIGTISTRSGTSMAPGVPGYGYDDVAYDAYSEEAGRALVANTRPASMPAPMPSTGGMMIMMSTDRDIIKSASLALLVKDIDRAVTDIRTIAVRFGGTIEHLDVYETPTGMAGGYVTVRVPTMQFDAAFAAMKESAIKVERESVNAQDVTEQLVDIDARLLNLRAEEEQYLEIMDDADNVEETLQVAERLYRVREHIERLEAQKENLTRQVAMSTITAELTAEKDIEVLGVRWRPLATIKVAVRGLLDSLAEYANFLIALVIALPVIFLWLATLGLFLWIVWRLGLAIRRRF